MLTHEEMSALAAEIAGRLVAYQKPVLTMDEAATYTGLSKSKLYKLTSTREIPHYKPTGGAVFFRRDELDAWLLRQRVESREEIGTKAYLLTHPVGAAARGVV